MAEAATSAEAFFHAYDAAELGALLTGFIVVAVLASLRANRREQLN